MPAAGAFAASETLAAVKSRGTLRCGVSDGNPGFSQLDAQGRWSGIDADFCRAVAAAVLGDAEKVTFVPLRTIERFPALQSRRIDLLARNTSWTLLREAALNVRFIGVLYYAGEAFMVPRKLGVRRATELKGAPVCVVRASTTLENLRDYSTALGLKLAPVAFDTNREAAAALADGRCRALAGDDAVLAGLRLELPGGAAGYDILPERISKEALSPVVRAGDEDWLLLVRWVLFVLVGAEERGVTAAKLREKSPHTVVLQQTAEAARELGKVLRIDGGWAVRAVAATGNYGEIFERNLGRESPLKLERGLNRPWTQGGLMFAPPP